MFSPRLRGTDELAELDEPGVGIKVEIRAVERHVRRDAVAE